MQRRKFLFSSGILASAMVAAPSSVWSADNSKKIAVLIIRDEWADDHAVCSAVKSSSRHSIHELDEEEMTELSYSSQGFSVTTKNKGTLLAEKIIFSSHKKIDISPSSIKIKAGGQHIGLQYDAVNEEIPAPEFWAMTTRKIDNGKISSFVKRNRHAFLCISGTN